MKIQRNAIIVALILVILLAFVALGFFWIEETVPQDAIIDQTPIVQENQEPERQLYLTIMTHMEGSFLDDQNENLFLRHVQDLRHAMDLADKVGAILSIETEKPFAIANTTWGINFMKEVLDRGHGVQTHCDLGFKYTSVEMSPLQYSEAFKENKTLVDDLVGADNNIGCSGGPGINDWAIAASIAGFKYLNGIVAGHMLAMPYENRPGTIWTDEYLTSDGWHQEFPEELSERIYPIPLADANNFDADDNPVIIALPGTIGRLDQAYEGPYDQCVKNSNCEFNMDDIDAIIDTINEVAEIYDPERGIAKMTVYVPADLYIEENNELLTAFFTAIGKLEDQGLFQFGTHQEIYEAYIEQTGFKL